MPRPWQAGYSHRGDATGDQGPKVGLCLSSRGQCWILLRKRKKGGNVLGSLWAKVGGVVGKISALNCMLYTWRPE